MFSSSLKKLPAVFFDAQIFFVLMLKKSEKKVVYIQNSIVFLENN